MREVASTGRGSALAIPGGLTEEHYAPPPRVGDCSLCSNVTACSDRGRVLSADILNDANGIHNSKDTLRGLHVHFGLAEPTSQARIDVPVHTAPRAV